MTADKNDKKGFGAFDDLVSDVSKEVEENAQRAMPEKATLETSERVPEDSLPSAQSPVPENTPTPSNPSGKGHGGAIFGLIAISLFVVFVLISNLGGEVVEDTTISTPSSQEPSVSEATESVVPDSEAIPVVETVNPEEKPPVGNGLVFNYNQIRYCLSEDIRLGAVKSGIDNYSQYEVNRFNDAVDDYNSRCSHYRYHSGALETVRSEVDSLHAALVLEGLHQLDSWRSSAPPPPIKIEYKADITEPSASSSTGEQNGEPDLSNLNSEERRSIESICKVDKSLYGPAAYYKCLANQRASLETTSIPDLSGLSADEQGTIESICRTDKSLYGPAAYYKCLQSQVSKLR